MLHNLDRRPTAWRYGPGILAVVLAALVTRNALLLEETRSELEAGPSAPKR